MTAASRREELIEKIRKAQDTRGGVKKMSIKSPVTQEEVEFMNDAEIEAAINAMKRELRDLDNPAPRIFSAKVSKGY